MNRKEFGVLMMLFVSAYEWFGVESKAKTDLWFQMLRDIDSQLLSQVVMEWIRYESKPPTIAQLRTEAVRRLNGFITAEEAWMVCQEPRRIRTAETKKALEYVGGYIRVRESIQPDLLRSQFLKAYNNFVDLEIRHQCSKNMIGRPSYMNGQKLETKKIKKLKA